MGGSFLQGNFEVGQGQQAVLLSVPRVLDKKELCHVQDYDLFHLPKPKFPVPDAVLCSAERLHIHVASWLLWFCVQIG